MSCAGTESVQLSNNVPRVKTGFLRRYNNGFFASGWKQEYFVLFQDSTLAWFEDQNKFQHKGGINLKKVCKFLAVGPFTQNVPNRPDLPNGGRITNLIAFPVEPSKKAEVIWILCSDQEELNSWMKNITSTLPPPPRPPQQGQGPPGYPGAPPGGPPPPGFIPTVTGQPTYPPQGQQFPPPQQGQYPPPQQGYSQQQHGRGQPQGGGTTVVVQGDRGRRRGSGGDFATGMLVGGALGYGMGRPMMGYGGLGYGGWGGGGYGGYHDHGDNININNYNSTEINNTENNETNETNVENNYGEGYGQGGGYGDGEGWGGGDGDGGYDGGGYDGGGYDDGGYDDGGGYDGGYDDGGYDDGGYDDGGGDFDGGD